MTAPKDYKAAAIEAIRCVFATTLSAEDREAMTDEQLAEIAVESLGIEPARGFSHFEKPLYRIKGIEPSE